MGGEFQSLPAPQGPRGLPLRACCVGRSKEPGARGRFPCGLAGFREPVPLELFLEGTAEKYSPLRNKGGSYRRRGMRQELGGTWSPEAGGLRLDLATVRFPNLRTRSIPGSRPGPETQGGDGPPGAGRQAKGKMETVTTIHSVKCRVCPGSGCGCFLQRNTINRSHRGGCLLDGAAPSCEGSRLCAGCAVTAVRPHRALWMLKYSPSSTASRLSRVFRARE